MSTTTIITEDVLLANPEFIAWCDTWQDQGRCPLPMADWMLETYGDERMYRAARWAYAKEERKVPESLEIKRVNPRKIDRYYMWWPIEDDPEDRDPDDVPIKSNNKYGGYWLSFPAAIAFYFVHFDLELANKYPPKDEVWT